MFDTLPERADSGAWRAAHMVGHMVHAVPVLSVVRCTVALCLVAIADGHHQTGFPNFRPMGDSDADTYRHPIADQHGNGLLDIYPETEGTFLRNNHRNDSRSGSIVGFPLYSVGDCQSQTTDVDRCGIYFHRMRLGLSADGYLRTRCSPNHGHLVVAVVNQSDGSICQ